MSDTTAQATAPVTETPPVAPVVETAPATTPEVKPTPVSPQFAALAKKEKAILMRDKAIKQREAELAKREAEITQKAGALPNLEALRDQAKANPLKVMEQLGLSYKQVTDFILNGEKPTAESAIGEVKSEIENLRKEREQERLSALEAEKARAASEEAEARQEFKQDIASHVTQNASTLELCSLYDPQGDVIFQTIEDYYEHTLKETGTGKVMSIEEASEVVENYLAEQAAKILQTNKIKAKLAPPKADPKEEPRMQQPSKTLSNVVSSAPSMLPPKTEQERVKRALAKLGG